MSLKPASVPSQFLGSLQSCLVEGDPQQRLRERKIRRRALVISVILQTAILGVLVLLPLFGKPAPISAITMPVPIYRNLPAAAHAENRTPRPNTHRECVGCFRSVQPLNPNSARATAHHEPEQPDEIGSGAPPAPCPTCIDIVGKSAALPPPPVGQEKPKTVYVARIDPAKLIHRVEPVYPILARQTGRSGRVELHAIVATDGTIKSLQIVAGDPFFYISAKEAVSQWRYTPTMLNGQRVEVDTFITVIYNISRR
jgi:TonB family protein